MKRAALLVIDVQNDYFPGGKYPLWKTEAVLDNIVMAIRRARDSGVPVVLIQHVADPEKGTAPFFNEGTEGVQIHPKVLREAPEAPIVVKRHADSFYATKLEGVLQGWQTSQLVLCGMMTQNCVTHTAISLTAGNYEVVVLPECCTTVDEMIHGIALHGMSTRVELLTVDQALP